MQKILAILIVVIALALAVYAVGQRREAERQAGLVAAPALALQAYQMNERVPWLAERAALLALDAYARGPTLETGAILRGVAESLPRSVVTIPHEDVRVITFTSRGLLLTGGNDGLLRVWQSDDWSEMLTLEHEGRIGRVVESPDGTRLAVLEDRGRTISIWDMASGELHNRIEHSREISGVIFSPSGQLIVATNYQYPAIVWAVDSGELVFESGDIDVVNAAFGRGDELLAATGRDAEIQNSFVHVWELATGKELFRERHAALNVAISVDGSLIASSDTSGHIKLWSMSEQRQLRSWDLGERVDILAFRHGDRLHVKSGTQLRILAVDSDQPQAAFDGSNVRDVRETRVAQRAGIVATLDRKNIVRVWDRDTSREIAWLALPGNISEFVIDGTGGLLATTGRDQPVDVWALDSAIMRHSGVVTGVAFSPDGRRVISSGADGTTRIWDLAQLTELMRFEHGKRVNDVAYDPAGEWIAAGDAAGMIRIWTADDFAERFRMYSGSHVSALAVNSDSSYLAAGGSSAQLWRLDVAIGTKPIETNVTAVAFSPDGERLATGRRERVQLWAVDSLEQVADFPHERATVRDVEYSPAGDMFASAASDGRLRLWNLDSGEIERTMLHEDAVESAAFSPDGQQVASASRDGTARIWSVATGEELARLPLAGGGYAVTFSPDGKRLATGSASGRVRLWPVSMTDVVAETCRRLTRSLTDEEVAQYLGGAQPAHTCRR